MTLNQSARELLDRYLLAIRRSLIGKQREDISREIESYILDLLEERHPDPAEITFSQMSDVLTEMGAPRKVATQFGPQRCLISPQLFPAYIMVLKIVVAVMLGALTLSFLIGTLSGESRMDFPTGLEFLGTLWDGALSAGVFVTLAFAIIDRVNLKKDLRELAELDQFDPEDLPDLSPEEKELNTAGTIIEMVLGVIGLAFFAYIYSNAGHISIFGSAVGDTVGVRLFTDDFLRFVPVMLATSGLEVARNATLLMQGHHASLTAWWHILNQGANLILTFLLLQSFPLVNLSAFLSLPGTSDIPFPQTQNGLDIGLKIILVLALIGTCVDLIRCLYQEIRHPSGS